MDDQKFLFKNSNHLANLNNMRLSGKMCDVTIKVNDKEFRAHKHILAASLKYFDSMFSNNFQENKQDVITMQDVKEEDLEVFISFAYTGEILLTNANALSLLELANYLTEDVIKEACVNFLVKNLKKEDACRAYKLTNVVDCVSLKNVSRSIITLNFEYCSQTMEYFDFDCESLKAILINTSMKLASFEKRRLVFEGVMRWIMHDAMNRRDCINDLLDIVQITKLNGEFLLEYLCNYTENRDHEDIVMDIMSFYRKKKQEIIQTGNIEQNLMVIHYYRKKNQLQLFEFTKKKWYRLCKIDCKESNNFESWTILNDKIYYAVFDGLNNQIKLQVFDPAEDQNKVLFFDSRLLSETAMCSCDKFLYFCGGEYNEDGPMSSDVLRYDTLINSFKTLSPMRVARSGAAAIFYQGYLHVLGGTSDNPEHNLNLVEKYDPDTKVWLDFPSMCEVRNSPAVAVLDGKLYACGGYHRNSVEVYDPLINNWRLVSSMKKERWWFSVVPHKGKLLAIGGDSECPIEVYDPSKDQWEIDPELLSGFSMPD